MTIASDARTASNGLAHISTKGIATFAAGDATLAQQIIATEAAINANGTAAAGQVAIFQHDADSFVFVSDGVDGIGANDVLVQLTGVNTLLPGYDEIALFAGNFTLI